MAAADLFTLSRPVKSGEAVDYFMSHSCELPRSGMRAQILRQRYGHRQVVTCFACTAYLLAPQGMTTPTSSTTSSRP